MQIIAQQSIPKIEDSAARVTVILRRHENGTYCTQIRNDDTGNFFSGHYDLSLPEAWADFGERISDIWPRLDGRYVPELPPLIKPKEITLIRATGPLRGASVNVDEPIIVRTYDEADRVIRRIAETAPLEGEGYDKVDIVVAFEDGYVFHGRYDAVREDRSRSEMLQQHIREHAQFLAGLYRPSWVNKNKDGEEIYLQAMARYEKDGTAQAAREFLAKYDVGQRTG
jgi:hypothetical protein